MYHPEMCGMARWPNMSCAFDRHSFRNLLSGELCHANHALGHNRQAGCTDDVCPKRIRGAADRAPSLAPSHCDPLVRSCLFPSIGGGAGGLGCGGTNYDIAAASAPLHSTRRETKIDQDQRELPTAAEGAERIVNHAADEGFFVVPFNLWLRPRATVRKYSEREQVLSRFDILYSCLESWPQISKPRTNFLYIRAFCFPVAAALWFCARPTVPHMKQGLKQMRKEGSKKSRAQQVMLDFY